MITVPVSSTRVGMGENARMPGITVPVSSSHGYAWVGGQLITFCRITFYAGSRHEEDLAHEVVTPV